MQFLQVTVLVLVVLEYLNYLSRVVKRTSTNIVGATIGLALGIALRGLAFYLTLNWY